MSCKLVDCMYIMRAFAERCFRTDHNFAIDESFFFFFWLPFYTRSRVDMQKYWFVNNIVKYSISSEACHWYLWWCTFPHWYFVFSIQKQIFSNENILNIENIFNQVNISYNNSIDKYQSVSFRYTDSVVLLSHEKELGASVVMFNPFSTNVLLMQRPDSWFLLARCLKSTCRRVTFC